MLNINNVFWTFQGEGQQWGRRALFVRMPFCNLACSWCDTTFNSFVKWTEEDFKAFATQESARFAVVTGGEPMMHKHTQRVVDILKELGFYVACETNGTFAPVNGMDYITCSPKRDADYDIHKDMFDKVSEYKYVVDTGFDWKVLDKHDVNDGKFYSLSPEFGRFKESLQEIFEYIKANPKWRISLQTHKWMEVP